MRNDSNKRSISTHTRSRGFTLAEVLITLGIIGVVAAMSIPTLLHTINDMQYKTAYKKAYASLTNAVALANVDDLFISASSGTDPRPTGFEQNFLAIMSKFSVVKSCTAGTNDYKNCWEDSGEGYGSGHYPKWDCFAFTDNSGMSWAQYYYGALIFFVDTNGFAKPNQWGKDRFVFWVVDDKGLTETPMGKPIKVIPIKDNSWMCNSASGLPNKCVTTQDYYGTSWLMQ